LLENPEDELDLDPLVESSYFTEPHPNQPLYSPIENLFSTIQTFNQPLPIHTITMAQPTNGAKELNLNKPEAFDGNQNNFKDFLQTVEVYMDVNHETYNNDLRKIAFVLSFMTTGAASTWKAQFIDEACYEQLLLFFSSSLTCGCLMFFILLIFTRVYLQENTSCQTHVLHVFASW
jgi:hypothetical protein